MHTALTEVKRPEKIFHRFFVIFFWFLIILCSSAEPAHAVGNSPTYTAAFVIDPTHPTPTLEFDCTQNVYAYFTWSKLKDLHQLTVLWINPKGKQQNKIDLKFVGSAEKTINWVALKFLDLRKERNPLLPDITPSDFTGRWVAQIFLDGNFLEGKSFNVQCN